MLSKEQSIYRYFEYGFHNVIRKFSKEPVHTLRIPSRTSTTIERSALQAVKFWDWFLLGSIPIGGSFQSLRRYPRLSAILFLPQFYFFYERRRSSLGLSRTNAIFSFVKTSKETVMSLLNKIMKKSDKLNLVSFIDVHHESFFHILEGKILTRY